MDNLIYIDVYDFVLCFYVVFIFFIIVMLVISLVVFIGSILVIIIVYKMLRFWISINYYYVSMVVFDFFVSFISWLLYFIEEMVLRNESLI